MSEFGDERNDYYQIWQQHRMNIRIEQIHSYCGLKFGVSTFSINPWNDQFALAAVTFSS
jgi:hypothetical protein